MATFTAGDSPVQLIRGRPFTLPMTWQTAGGSPTPIDITDYAFAGTVTWPQGADTSDPTSADLIFTTTDAANGLFSASLDAGNTAEVPDGPGVFVGMTLTDGSGDTKDFTVPVTVVTPPGFTA